MGMNFSPMYQPVSTKTIKADGDLNVDPYDVIAVDGKFDTVEADEFVGGVGNFSSGLISGNLSVDGSLEVNKAINTSITGFLFIPSTISGTSGDYIYATAPALSSVGIPKNLTGQTVTITIPDFVVSLPEYTRVNTGVYTRLIDVKGGLPLTRPMVISNTGGGATHTVYYKKTTDDTYSSVTIAPHSSVTVNLETSVSYELYSSSTTETISADTYSIYTKLDTPE